jgi:hypothetical protein
MLLTTVVKTQILLDLFVHYCCKYIINLLSLTQELCSVEIMLYPVEIVVDNCCKHPTFFVEFCCSLFIEIVVNGFLL